MRLKIAVLMIITLLGCTFFLPRPEPEVIMVTSVPYPTQIPLSTPTPITVVEVVMAVQDIPAGIMIQPNMVMSVIMPIENVPLRAFGSVDEVVGYYARNDIYREQLILSNMLLDTTNLDYVGESLQYVWLAADDIPAGTTLNYFLLIPLLVERQTADTNFQNAWLTRSRGFVGGLVAQADIPRYHPITHENAR